MKRLVSLATCFLFVMFAISTFADAPGSPSGNTTTHIVTVSSSAIDPYLILVNKQHALPDNWLSLIELIETKNSLDEEFLVERETLERFNALRSYLLEEYGIQIELDSTYRSLAEQQEIWDEWSADPELGPEYCALYLSPVGYSEHHTGLAVDIFIVKDGTHIRDNDDMIADEEDFAIIHQHLAEFGFILRYPQGKESVTGYNYEPWHFRYVGDRVVAEEIMNNNLTLEEYLESR